VSRSQAAHACDRPPWGPGSEKAGALGLVRLAGWLNGGLIWRERKILLDGWLAGGWTDFA